MFFKDQSTELSRINKNLQAQRDLLTRQLQEGSISPEYWQKEEQRLATIMSSHLRTIEAAISGQIAPMGQGM